MNVFNAIMSHPQVNIGALESHEIQSALEIVRASFDSSFHEAAQVDISATFSSYPYAPLSFIAKDRNWPVGFVQSVTAYFHPNTYSIVWLCVLPGYRKQGIGASLLSFAEEFVTSTRFSRGNGSFLLVSTITPAYYEQFGYMHATFTHDGHPLMIKHVRTG